MLARRCLTNRSCINPAPLHPVSPPPPHLLAFARRLWLFHRQPVAPKADLDAMMAAAKALRLDTSRLVPVNQVGCKYAGAAR